MVTAYSVRPSPAARWELSAARLVRGPCELFGNPLIGLFSRTQPVRERASHESQWGGGGVRPLSIALETYDSRSGLPTAQIAGAGFGRARPVVAPFNLTAEGVNGPERRRVHSTRHVRSSGG